MARNLTYILTVLLCLSIAFSAGTTEKTYSEDFKTKEYCDVENTSGSWDCLRGEIKLPPYDINLIGEYSTIDAAWGIKVEGDSVYVADGFGGVLLYDMTDINDLQYLGYYEVEGEVHSLDIQGDFLYIAAGENGFSIINKGFLFSSPDTDDDPEMVLKSSSNSSQVSAMDFINPDRSLLGSGEMASFTFNVEVLRDSLLVIASWDSLKVIKFKSVMDTNLPSLVDGKDTPGGAIDFKVVDDKVFVSNHNFGLEILDFNRLVDVVGTCETPGYPYGFDIVGDYLYMAVADSGMQVIDISNPELPEIVASYITPGYAVNVTVSGNYAYISDWDNGIVVVDISNPLVPVAAGSLPLEEDGLNWPWDVQVVGDYALAADHSGGLKVLQITPDYAMEYYQVQSTAVTNSDEQISRVKLETVQEGSVNWEISADNGDNWQVISADNSWHNIISPGNRLLWRSIHSYPGGTTNSPCSFLEIGWDNQVPTLFTGSGILLNGSSVEIKWSVSSVNDDTKFVVYRSLYPDENFEKVSVLDSRGRITYTFMDDGCEDGATYYYSVYTLADNEETLLFKSKPITIPSAVLSLSQNYPNPFNPLTTIRYNLSTKGHVVLNVYDVSGREINRLVDSEQKKGPHNIVWNGKDSAGNIVSSGVYFYSLRTENGNKTKKMVLLR